MNPTIKKLLYPFHLIYSLSTFFDLFYAIFFIKISNNFLAFKITNNLCPRNSVLNFFNYKNYNWSSDQFGT